MMNIQQTPRKRKLHTPENIPPEEWCDFRRDYESGMTILQIAEKYICDPRTVRRAIQVNKSSQELGHQTAPRKLTGYETDIAAMIPLKAEQLSICQLSRLITEQLRARGYTGSERTIRNHLRTIQPQTQNTRKRRTQKHD